MSVSYCGNDVLDTFCWYSLIALINITVVYCSSHHLLLNYVDTPEITPTYGTNSSTTVLLAKLICFGLLLVDDV